MSGTDKDNTVLWDFYCTKGRNSGTWQKIPVPSCWELQGFGTYHYGWEENYKMRKKTPGERIQMEAGQSVKKDKSNNFQKTSEQYEPEDNETGLYKYNFQSAPAWRDKTVRIVFEGSMTDTEVKINGKVAGPVHQGSFYRFKYDITNLLKDQNLLEVKVNKISSDTSVNRAERMADFWVFGGIYRPVYLEILPKQFIDWTAIDAKADGSFLMEVYLQGVKDVTQVEAQIKTLDGQTVGQSFAKNLKKGDSKVTVTTKVENPQTWNPEFPKLYQVEVRLKNAKGVVHTIIEKFGFRTVEFKEGNGFFVNGQKIVFKGTNRHTFWPTSGRTASKEISILDVNLMKEMNMNAVRMSHYPPDAHFLDVCDSLGLFVLDELTGWQKKYDTPVGRKLLKEMVMKDVNHPSIVIWDNGNEGGNNHDLVDDYALYDPQNRHVIHPWNIFKGTDTQHYKGYGCCAGQLYNGNLVFFPTEIIHGLYDGGHGAGLNDHWNLMMSNPLSAGCFLWVFADEGIVRHDKDSIVDAKDNRGADGIVGPFREKEGSFFTIKEIWSPVQIKNQKLMKDFDGILDVENQYFYTDLNQVDFKWRVTNLPSPWNESSEGEIIQQGEFKGPSVGPRQNGKLSIPLKRESAGDVLYLTAIDPHNKELFTWSWSLKNVSEINAPFTKKESNNKKVTVDESTDLVLSANGVEVRFDKQTGLVKGVKNELSAISFSNGPVLAAGASEFQSYKHFVSNGNHVVEMQYKGDLKKVKYTMMPNGVLGLEYAYHIRNRNSPNTFDFLGINFNYPEDKVTGVKYLGRGPYRVWKNRMKGGEYNIWKKKYNNTITGESWDYPEFKGYYRDFTWVVIENKEHPFRIFSDTDNLFLRLYTPEKPKGARNDNTSPPFPEGDISILHGISAIGTKFDGADNNGPEGAKNKVGAEWITGSVYFDFRSSDK